MQKNRDGEGHVVTMKRLALRLERETLRRLSSIDLEVVRGGIIAKSTDPDNTGCP